MKNLPENHNISFENSGERYEVTLTGSDSALKGVDITDLGAYIDMSGYGDGAFDVEVKFDLPDGVRLSKTLNVSVVLSEREVDEEEPTPTPETTEIEEALREDAHGFA